MAAMTISSVGVRVMDDFDTLPLFDSPPLDGPTTKVGSLARGVPARAIEKVADFLLLEGDDEDGGNSGTLGWADASCLAPTSFPAFYEFASDLPEGANLVVRASPQPGAAALGQISSYDPILLATGLQGEYISMVHRDRDNPSSPQLQGWMLMMTDDRVLLTLKPPLLIIPALGLPENAQLRVRSAPEATAPELGQLSAAPGSIFESAEQCEGWVRVLMDTSEASAWMSTAAKGMQLLQPAQRQTFVMDPELVAQHGEGVKLAVRSAPSQEGIHLGELTCKGRVHCVGERGPWLRVLYQGYKANLVVRASPQPGAAALGQISSYDPILLATGLQGEYISMVHRDRDNPSSPQLQGWMLMMTDDRVLLTLKPPLLIIPALGLPENAQLRVRSAPEATAPELGQLSAAPGSIFESAEQCEGWVRVLMDTSEASAWMSTAAKGMQLLQPAQRQTFVMDPELVAQHGEGVKLAVRSAPSQEGIHLGELTCKGRVHCVGERGPWLRVLYQGYKEAWMLACTGAFQLLVRADSIGGDASSYTNSGEQPSSVSRADSVAATPKSDGHRYMVCAKKATVRTEPEFYAMEVGYAAAESIVRVLDEKEEINHAKQTKDVWVRGQLAGVSSADGGGAAAAGSVLEGWIMAFSTKRGATLTDAPDALAAQVEFLKQEEAARAAVAPKVTREPSTEEAAAPTPAAPVPAPKALAPPPESSTKAGGYMRAEGMLKLREEADSLSMELSTITAGELVRVVETSGLWVRVSYRGSSKGWALTANKRGPLLSPVDASAVNAAEFDTQEASAAAAAAARGSDDGDSAADDRGEDNRPLTSAKAGSMAPSPEVGNGKEDAHDVAHMPSQPPPPAPTTPANASAAVDFMKSAGPLKIREQADPYSMEMGTTETGDTVKVLEVSDKWVRVAYRGREDGWILVANKRGTNLFPVEGDSAAAAEVFDAQEERYAAEAASATESPSTADDDDRPLSGAKPAASGAEAGDRPLDTGSGKGSWEPPSEFPTGHKVSQPPEGMDKNKELGCVRTEESAASSGTGQAKFMQALGPLKLRDEADPFSMELCVVDKGAIVKVLETSKLWVRVRYHGREDGWVLTANKRGPMLDPLEDASSAAKEFDDQEASYAASSATAEEAVDPDDRPLGGGKGSWAPPSEFPPGGETETVISDGDSRGVIKAAAAGVAAEPLCEGADDAGNDGTPSPEYMTALGPLKLREEEDPCSMELDVVDKGGIVKILQTSKQWVRVRYHGREDGWVLTANKRGPMLEIHEDVSSAAKEFDAQEASHAAASAVVDETAVDPDDRPLGGGKGSWAPPCEFPPGVDGEAVNSEGDNRGTKEAAAAAAGVADEPRCEGADFAEKDGTPSSPEYMTALGTVMARDEADSSSMGLSKVAMAVVEERMASRADRKSTNEGVESNAPGDDRPIGGGSGVGRPSGLNDDDNGAAVSPIKPWQRRQKGSTRSRTPSEGKDGAGTQDVVVGGDASAPTQEKPWQKKKREAFMSGGVRAVTTSGSGGVGDGNGNDADGVVGVGSDVTGGVEAGSGDGEGTLLGGGNGSTAKSLGDKAQAEAVDGEGVDDVQCLEACLEERDWKKRVAAFEGATRACRDGGDDTTAIVGPLLPRMLQDKNVQAVEAALEVLLAYLPLRSPMGEEEGAALSSALAERALCCGRGQVEGKADEAAKVLLRCDSGELAGRGAWLTLAARVGGLENEFFPPLEDGGVGGRGRSKAAIAASAPKAVAGCVRAMKAAIDGAAAVSAASSASAVTGSGAVVAGGGDSREAVYVAATALLASQKVPLKMAGVSLAKSLFAAEGQMAKDVLGVEEMEPRIKSQVERAFAEAIASAAKPASVPGPSQSAPALAASPPAGEHASRKVDATVESGGDPVNDALIATNVRADTSLAAEGDTGSLSEQPSADRDLSATPERAVKRPDEAAATGSPVVPRSRTPGRSPRTPVRGLPTPIPDSTRHFFKPATARRYTGYRALLAYGARTPLERETQFLGGQMLVLPDGQRSAWDDILDAVLGKCPPPTPFRRRHMLSDVSTSPSGLRDGYPSPLLPLSSPSQRSVASPAPTGLQYGVAGEARGGAVDADEKQDDSGDSLRCTSNTVGGIVAAARMAGQGSSVIARPVDGSLRERIAKLDARNPRKDGERGHALRDYRSWTGGMDGISSGAGDSTMGVMSSGGSAREGNLGSTASASNLQSREEALDNPSRQIAVKLDAENNSQGRGQMVRRRLSRGQSVGARLSAERDSLDLIAKAETAELAARAVETRDATDVFFAEFRARRLASNEHGALANGRSLAVAHEAEPGTFGTLPVVNAIPGFVGDSRGSSSRLAEPHRPHADSWVASGDVDQAVGDVVDEWPMSSGTVTEEGHLRLSRTSSGRESQPRPSELEANETPFGTPAGSPELSYDSDAEYLSLRSLLDKAGLRKYFRKFRHKEIRAENLKYLSEEDLEGIGLPLGARKRLLVEVHGIPSSTRETLHSPPSPASVATFSHRRGEDERSERDSQANSRASGGESFRDGAFSPRARAGSQASSRSSKTDSLTSEQILSPQRNASGMRRSATAARIPAPATTGVPVRRASSVSLHSAHARSRQQEEQQRYHTTGGGEGGRETNYTEGSARVSLRGQADVRATSAGSGPAGSSPFFGGRRRERSTIAGSGAEERLAKAVAAERALNATAAAVNQLQDNPSSVPTRPSGIPRRAPGASRLRAPATRGGRSTGVGGISPLTRSRDGGREQSASAAVVTDPSSGEGQQREMAVPLRRISRTLQAPRERRTSMSRRPNQA